MTKEEVVIQLQCNGGYDVGEILGYWAMLECDELPPAVAYIAVDSCFKHGSSVVVNWLSHPRILQSSEALPPDQRLVNYLVEMRRRSLKSRMEWPERRHEWTNQINRAKHYAGKFYSAGAEACG